MFSLLKIFPISFDGDDGLKGLPIFNNPLFQFQIHLLEDGDFSVDEVEVESICNEHPMNDLLNEAIKLDSMYHALLTFKNQLQMLASKF